MNALVWHREHIIVHEKPLFMCALRRSSGVRELDVTQRCYFVYRSMLLSLATNSLRFILTYALPNTSYQIYELYGCVILMSFCLYILKNYIDIDIIIKLKLFIFIYPNVINFLNENMKYIYINIIITF